MTIALAMIVRDESAVIDRVLKKMLPLVDTWVIVDTGSKDDTMDKIRKVSREMGKPSGHLHERTWRNFGDNRSELMELCNGTADWVLMCDADDYVTGGQLPPLDRKFAGYYVFLEEGGNMMHRRVQIMNIVDHQWRYKMAVHEYPYRPKHDPPAQDDLAQIPLPFKMVARREGARSRDPQKYLKDARMLQEQLNHDPHVDVPRGYFYLAQSFRDARKPKEAIKYYKKREEMVSTWAEERYVSALNLVLLHTSIEDKMKYGWRAMTHNNRRKEATYYILKFARENNIWREDLYAMGFACKDNKPDPEGMLFLETDAYSWRFWDELSLHAFYTQRKVYANILTKLSMERAKQEKATDSDLQRIQKNLTFCKISLPEEKDKLPPPLPTSLPPPLLK